jgi:hypothetical protein
MPKPEAKVIADEGRPLHEGSLEAGLREWPPFRYPIDIRYGDSKS